MEPLGRLVNAMTTATTSKTYCGLNGAEGVLVLLIGATSGNATIYTATSAAAAGEVAFTGADAAHGDGITVYWTWASGTWTKRTQPAGSTITAVTGGLASVFIPAYALPSLYTYVTASHSSGSFIILPCDLDVQRRPSSLASNTA